MGYRSKAAEGGFIRIVAQRDNHRVLGAVGTHVSELSGEFIHAIEMGAVLRGYCRHNSRSSNADRSLPRAGLTGIGPRDPYVTRR
jgi:dihydrolipoamide dehydrogenase